MEKKKSELLKTEKAREELEKERNAFSHDLDRRRDLLVKFTSVLDVARPEEKTAFFETTLRGRTDLYRSLYERKKDMLTAERERLKGEINDLADYIAALKKQKSVSASTDLGVFFRTSAERELLSRLFFLIEKGEYEKAVRTLDTLLSLDRKGANRLQAGLLREILKLLDDYRERTAVFKKGGGLDELKMAYLREDYGKAGELANRLNADGYLLPVLVEFQMALERNERLSRVAHDDLGTKESLKSLSQKALALEKKGEGEKALKIYQSLLIFNLPADDRERVLGKIRTLTVASAKQEAKRQENTKASAYLENAKLADREGREEEAVENYKKIVLECPNSDYAAEALMRLIALLKAGGV
jgi:tetratricopeptide (TPR) repeat protein